MRRNGGDVLTVEEKHQRHLPYTPNMLHLLDPRSPGPASYGIEEEL